MKTLGKTTTVFFHTQSFQITQTPFKSYQNIQGEFLLTSVTSPVDSTHQIEQKRS
jgi:hypothetical protein